MTSKPRNKWEWNQPYFDGYQLRAGKTVGIPSWGFQTSAAINAAPLPQGKKETNTVAKKAQLFVDGKFTSHSGQELLWKVECDAMSEAEWQWAAARVAERFSFRGVHGVPSGGLYFEKALRPYIRSDGDCYLIVDDVLTTGGSMEEAKERTQKFHRGVPRIGVVLFARRTPSPWIAAIWPYWGC